MPIIEKINEFTGELELEVPGTIISNGQSIMRTKDSLKRPYRFSKVEIIYPNGKKHVLDSLLFESLRVSNPSDYSPQSKVILKVFGEGSKKGRSQILPSKKLNLKTPNDSLNCLPLKIQTNLLWVGDEYRTNLLSLLPGGYSIVIEYCDGNVFGYDKIKFKELYVQKILLSYFNEQNIEFDKLTNEKQKELLKIYISSIYFKEFSKQKDYEKADYQILWSSDANDFLPWE